jgi:hypothetical protein
LAGSTAVVLMELWNIMTEAYGSGQLTSCAGKHREKQEGTPPLIYFLQLGQLPLLILHSAVNISMD